MSNIPVAKRTRFQFQQRLQLLVQESKRRKRNNISSVDETDENRNQPNGSEFPSTSPKKSNTLDEFSHDVESNAEGSRVPFTSTVKFEESNDLDEISHDKSKDKEMNEKDLSPENFYESDPETSYVDSSESNGSDSDYAVDKEVDEEKGSKGVSTSAIRKIYGVEPVDTSSSDEFEEEKEHRNGSRVPSTSKKVEKSNDLDELSNDFDEFFLDESKDEESNEEESHILLETSDGIEVIDMTRKRKGNGSASSSKVKTQVNLVDVSDDSDSDDSEKGSKGSCRSTRRKFKMEKTSENRSGVPYNSTMNLEKPINIDESSVYALSNDEESSGEESHLPLQETDGLEENGNGNSVSRGYVSVSLVKTGTHIYFHYPSDDSDSDENENICDEPEDENIQNSCKDHESSSNPKASSFQSTEDESSSSSESEGGSKSSCRSTTKIINEVKTIDKSSSDESEEEKELKIGTFLKETDNHLEKTKHDEPNDANDNEKMNLWDGSNNRKEKNRSGPKRQKKRKDEKTNNEPSDVNDNEKMSLGDGSDNRKEKNHSGPKRQKKRRDEKTNDEPSNGRKENNHSGHKTHKKNKDKKPTDEATNVNGNDKTNANDEVGDGLNDSKEKNHQTDMKKMNQKPMDESDAVNVQEETNANDKVEGSDTDTEGDEENIIINPESKKGGQKDDDGRVNDMLDSIIGKERFQEKDGDDCIPLKFKFDDSEDEAASQETYDFGATGLFEEMDFALDCDEIGSYKTATVQKQQRDNDDTETCQSKLSENGDHRDIYFEEQTGMRCGLCGAVILESRYVMPKLANYVADRSKRSYLSGEQQLGSSESINFKASNSNHLYACNQTKGTVWELIPASYRANLYPHQQEGFEFLWKNLAGTVELSSLHKLGSRGGGDGGGCIISHAPGTGKTLLTIVFMESFLKRFPNCCPVIVAPASMLLTWEAEFKKWKVGLSFLNLNNSEFLCNEVVNSGCTQDMIRTMKIKSWSDGGSVLGVSYSLYGKLAGNRKTQNSILEKMGNVLLDMPGLVILDEGHTPRNQNSNIWNTFLKLKTKNRVILSGTPFQNNFRELFNTLGLVRPETAMNEKYFTDMINQNNKKKSGGTSTTEDIDKLKVIIKPFVHVHKGHILESKLPGLKQNVLLLNPSPLQKSCIENFETSANTFEYDHKVALVSVHPSLILHCSLCEKEKRSTNKKELENVRLDPEAGVKTRFAVELVRLSISLHEKVLVFSQYTQPLQLLKDQLALTFNWKVGKEIEVIKGRTRQKLRQKIINDFNDPKGKVKVLLASIRCCSEGIHLTGASRVVLLDVVWNPSVERQAISRAYRLGQKKVVYTYHLMTAGTTEEEKYDRQVEKGRLAEMVFTSAGEEANKKLNVDGFELDDTVLEQMLGHKELNDIFIKITSVENESRS